MSEVKGECHILYAVSNECTSFLFHINPTNLAWDMAKISLDLEKTHPKCLKKICQNNSFQQNSSKISPGNNHDYANKVPAYCSDWMSGSHFIVQTITFLLIDATTVTGVQGQGRVIQISIDVYLPLS